MKARRTSTNALRVGINLGLVAAIFLLSVFIIQLIQPKEPPTTIEQTYTVELDDYRYYRLEDVDYGFILARMILTSNQLFEIDLQSMITNELVTLHETSLYTIPLIDAGYRLSCPGTDEISGLRASICVFIPVINRTAGELVLKVNLDRPHNLSFNLLDESHFGTKAMLGITDVADSYAATIIKYRNVSTRSFTVEDAEGATVEAPFSSQSRVLGFELQIHSELPPTTIETATLTLTGIGTFQLVNPEYTNDEESALIGVSITAKHVGYLFFEITNPDIDLSALDPSIISLSLRASGETHFITVGLAP